MNPSTNIRRLRLLSALNHTLQYKSQHSTEVEDVKSFIEKADYDVKIRLEQIKNYQEFMVNLERKLVEGLRDINQLMETPPSSPPYQRNPSSTQQIPTFVQSLLSMTYGDLVPLGPNGTTIPRSALTSINWGTKEAFIIRKVLMTVFDPRTLATHTLSGKPSPAFMGINKELKMQLDRAKVEDITYFIMNCFNMPEKEVRHFISMKCANEAKLMKLREQRRERKQLKAKNSN